MVFKDSWFQKSKEINDKCDRKPGPKKRCKIKEKMSQNRQHFEKYMKKCIPESMRKKGVERNRKKAEMVPNRVRPGSNFGPAGEGFREGVVWFSIWLSGGTHAPGGCGGY